MAPPHRPSMWPSWLDAPPEVLFQPEVEVVISAIMYIQKTKEKTTSNTRAGKEGSSVVRS